MCILSSGYFSSLLCCVSFGWIFFLFMVIIFLMLDKNEITIFPRRRVCFMPPRLLVWARFFASPSVETFVTSLHRLWTVRFVFEKHFLVQCIECCTGMHWGKVVRESLRDFRKANPRDCYGFKTFHINRLMTTHETLLLKNKSSQKIVWDTLRQCVCSSSACPGKLGSIGLWERK